jgi:beta-lactam-binding protein with PASTA domain
MPTCSRLVALVLVGLASGQALGARPAAASDAGLAQGCVVPNVAGKTFPAAETAVRRAGCSVGRVTGVYSAGVPKGRVVSERPGAGKSLPRGSKITLLISRGPR